MVQRGFKHIMGVETRYDDSTTVKRATDPTLAGALIANPPTGFDVELERMHKESRTALNSCIGAEKNGYTYFWATKAPMWYQGMTNNHEKICNGFVILPPKKPLKPEEMTRNDKRKMQKQKKIEERDRKATEEMNAFERMKLQRRYVDEGYKQDEDPEDIIEPLLKTLKKADKWNPKRKKKPLVS